MPSLPKSARAVCSTSATSQAPARSLPTDATAQPQATVTLGGPPFSFYGVPQTQLEAHTDGFLSTDIGTIASRSEQ